MISIIIGDVIRTLRKKKGISQDVLSGLADIGRTHLSMIERGKRTPTLETLFKISGALGMNVSDILRIVEDVMSHDKGQPGYHGYQIHNQN